MAKILTDTPSGLRHIPSPNDFQEFFVNRLGRVVYAPGRSFSASPIVYYLERADGRIKIGTSRNYGRRRGELIKSHGHLALVGWEHGTGDLELLRHRQFAEYRVDRIAEWFEPGVLLIDWLLFLAAVRA